MFGHSLSRLFFTFHHHCLDLTLAVAEALSPNNLASACTSLKKLLESRWILDKNDEETVVLKETRTVFQQNLV